MSSIVIRLNGSSSSGAHTTDYGLTSRLARYLRHLHHAPMRELLVYGISGLASLFIFGYTVHMFVGGLVSEQTETILIILVVLIAAVVEAWLIWDAMRGQRLR